VPGDHAIGLALKGQQRPADEGDRSRGALDVGGRVGCARGRPFRERVGLRAGIGPAGERIGARRPGRRQPEGRGDDDDQDDQAGHQLVAQLSTMVSG
jgi:hypothetical protein